MAGGAEVVGERFAFLREANLQEPEKGGLVLNTQLCAFSRNTQRDERRLDLRRGLKSARRNMKEDFGAGVHLGEG